MLKRYTVYSPDGTPRRSFFFRWFARDYAVWCAQQEFRTLGTAHLYRVGPSPKRRPAKTERVLYLLDPEDD